jgi:hypothetical protein
LVYRKFKSSWIVNKEANVRNGTVSYLMFTSSLERIAVAYNRELGHLPTQYVYPDQRGYPSLEQECSSASDVYNGTILACADRTDICVPETGECWDVLTVPDSASLKDQDQLQGAEAQSILFLLGKALRFTSIYDDIYELTFMGRSEVQGIRNPSALCAQWEATARRLFETSLARAQVEIWDIARGTLAHTEGLVDQLPPAYRGICNMIKFKTVGWKNVNAFWTFTCLALGLFCWVGSMEFGGNMVVVIMGVHLYLGLKLLTQKTWEFYCFVKCWIKVLMDRVYSATN